MVILNLREVGSSETSWLSHEYEKIALLAINKYSSYTILITFLINETSTLHRQ
jgi:hypothetical protein